MNILDCSIFGSGGVFGGGYHISSEVPDEKIAEILAGYNIYIQAGNATTIETLTIIDGGTATSEDLLSFSGGSSLD